MFDSCRLEDKEVNQILFDGTLIDNLFNRAFVRPGECYSVQGVIDSLNAANYQTTNDEYKVVVDGIDGYISVHVDRLFFNSNNFTDDIKIAASLGIDVSNKSWLVD